MNGTASDAFCGRLALVTGGGSGIGRAVCIILAQRGARVLVTDIDLDAANTTLAHLRATAGPAEHAAMQIDVGCPSSVKAVFDSIQKEPVSIVVHCAGVLGSLKSFLDLDVDEFDRIMSVNLRGTFLVTQSAAQCMLRTKVADGCIVNIASAAARTKHPGFSAYSASKAAVSTFTRCAAVDVAGAGIRVNAVAPCLTDTPMASKGFSEAQMAQYSAGIPLGRAARPEEVASVVAFLCGADSAFVTGTTVDVSGGL
ncbi:(3R)-3-hydroxyacyl-CoA dehydrogenase-like isoform X2 [Amblyomma americanum]